MLEKQSRSAASDCEYLSVVAMEKNDINSLEFRGYIYKCLVMRPKGKAGGGGCGERLMGRRSPAFVHVPGLPQSLVGPTTSLFLKASSSGKLSSTFFLVVYFLNMINIFLDLQKHFLPINIFVQMINIFPYK